MPPIYSHRQRASNPRDLEVVGLPAWIAIRETIMQLLRFGYFAKHLPLYCEHCDAVVGTNDVEYYSFVKREIPRLDDRWKYDVIICPETETIFDLVELTYFIAARASTETNYNCVFPCKSMTFNQSLGRNECLDSFNRIFDSERLAYQLNSDGQVVPLGAPILSDMIQDTNFQTGDDELDGLLETARDKFISRDPAVRKEGLDKLWDAWERLKTLEPGKDKKASTGVLLDRVADGPMRGLLETEADALTKIGNKPFIIRHSETDRHPLEDDGHVDYLFHRMFSLVYLLLDGTGRVGGGDGG